MPPQIQENMDDIRFDSAGQYNMAPTYGAFQQQDGHIEEHPSVHSRRRCGSWATSPRASGR